MAQKTPGLLKRLADPDEMPGCAARDHRGPSEGRPGSSGVVGAIAGPVDLNLSADGDWLRTYLLRALIRRMPEELRSDWRLTLGRRRGSIPLRFDINGRELHAGNVYLWEEKPEEGVQTG